VRFSSWTSADDRFDPTVVRRFPTACTGRQAAPSSREPRDGAAPATIRRNYAPSVDRVRVRAWVGTLVFLVLTPGVVAGLVPRLITGWRIPWAGGWVSPVAIVGGIAVLSGIVVLLDAFVRFARADGTPAPPMPTAHLVVVGPYRHVRNPMYLAVLSIVLGQALLFRSGGTLFYAGLVLLAVVLFVRGYEEPTLEEQYGEEYREYRRNVRGWIPRLRPWKQPA
jgi:protein-S-isoprenylcysteine O-methyltransferase Ste14